MGMDQLLRCVKQFPFSWQAMDNSGSASNASGSSIKDITDDDIGDGDDLAGDGDAEGVWSADIEQSFQEALSIYPPCGRRKIILSDEGKMYGRNELIARYIKIRTGKMRSRKQVSSHIQVMARRKSKEIQSQLKDQASKERALQALSVMSSAQIVSAAAIHNNNKSLPMSLPPLLYPSHLSHIRPSYPPYSSSMQILNGRRDYQDFNNSYSSPVCGLERHPLMPVTGDTRPAWAGRGIAGPRLRMVEFSSFLETHHPETDTYNKHLFVHIGNSMGYSDPMPEAVDIRQISDKFPENHGGLKDLYNQGPQTAFYLIKFWADFSNPRIDVNGFYGFNAMFESSNEMTIQCAIKACSFGKLAVEKVQIEYGHPENGQYVYRINRSPMCEYMVNFIKKLKELPEKYMMNSVLENFTVLQVVANQETQETLVCIAYVFEVSMSEQGSQHHIYRLVNN